MSRLPFIAIAFLSLASIPFSLASCRSAPPPETTPSESLATPAESGQPALAALIDPYGLAFDSRGRMYVTDQSACRILRIDDMEGKGWTSFELATDGKKWLAPCCFCADGKGGCYVAESYWKAIRHVLPWGRADGETFDGAKLGFSAGIYPLGIALGPDGCIYYVDLANCLVARMDDMNGKGWASWPPEK